MARPERASERERWPARPAGAQPDPPRRRPVQERSRFLVSVLVEACERILEREGSAALNATRLAEVSGVTRGTIYQYFPNVESIVAELYERKLREHLEPYVEAYRAGKLEPLEPREGIRQTVQAMARFHKRMLELDAPFHRKYIEHFDLSRWVDELTKRPRGALEFLAWILERHGGLGGRKDPEVVAFLIDHQLRALAEAARERPDYLDDENFVEMVVDMCVSILR